MADPKRKRIFTKPPLPLADQLRLLEERGLTIADQERAARYLRFIGYYRLAGYCRPFQTPEDPSHTFLPGTQFDDVLNLYIFDRKLRLLVMDAMERIEVAVRTVINDHMSLKHGAMWYTDYSHFQRIADYNHLNLMEIIKREVGYAPGGGKSGRTNAFCSAYFRNYCEPVLPPSWMVTECLSLGTWSMIYSTLTESEDRKHVSNSFNIRYEAFGSWLHALSYVRNICAHHAMLWSNAYTIKPKLTHEFKEIAGQAKFYQYAVIIQQFLGAFAAGSQWKVRLALLLQKCPVDSGRHMGFPADWPEKSYWQ